MRLQYGGWVSETFKIPSGNYSKSGAYVVSRRIKGPAKLVNIRRLWGIGSYVRLRASYLNNVLSYDFAYVLDV